MSDTEIIFEIAPTKDKETAPPAYFLSLTVENVRCFKEKQTLDLSDGNGRPARWTVILGENGVGKTTLLQCIAALTPDRSVLQQSIPAIFLAQINPVLHQWYGELVNTDKHRWLGTRLIEGNVFNFLDDLQGQFRTGIRIEISEDGRVGTFFHPYEGQTRQVCCFAYGANRTLGRDSKTDSDVFSRYSSLFSWDVSLLNAEDWFLGADYSARLVADQEKRTAETNYRDKVSDMLVKLLPGISELRAALPGAERIGKTVQMEALTYFGWVPFRSLSLGYQTLITWTVDLAARLFDRYPDSPDPLAEPAVVLVDEIDLHLHPRWQRELINFLSGIFKQTQFIVTAHSPLVVQAADDANIVLLRREGDQVVIDNSPESVRNWRVDQILASELFGQIPTRSPRIDRLMEKRTAILAKPTLTEEDRHQLAKLEAEIGKLPTGETPQDIEAMDIIRQAAELLKKNGVGNGRS